MQRRIPITNMPLPNTGAKAGDIWLTHVRGSVMKMAVRESGLTSHFWSGEPLFVAGSNSMGNGSTLKAYDLELSGLSAGTDNTVLCLDSADKVVTDEIDSRVWGATLLDDSDMTTHVANASAHHAKYTDAEAIAALEGEADVALGGTLTTQSNYVLEGYTTGRTVVRRCQIKIDNGTDASTLKCTVTSEWNGDAIGETDNISKGATTGNFTLNAAGGGLKIENAGLSGTVVAVLDATQGYNASGTAVTVSGDASSGDVRLVFRNPTTAAEMDLTSLVDTGILYIQFTYVTNA